jgi:uncharacterized delta-60 repeat protein
MRALLGKTASCLMLAAVCAIASAADGDLDTTFGTNGFRLTGLTDGYSSIPAGMAMQPDGKILLCIAEGDYPALDFFVARFTADGDLDTTFSFDGKTTIDFGGNTDICAGVAVQADGKIVVAGVTQPDLDTNSDFAIARLNADGTLDTATFGAGTGKAVVNFDLGGSNADTATSLALKANGKIVVGGYAATETNGFDFAILQLNTDGTRDTSFNLTGRATVAFDLAASTTKDDSATRVAIDTQGRIIIAGYVDAGTPGGTDFGVARLLAGGQVDPDFSADGRAVIAFDLGGATGANGDGAYSLTLQGDGRIVLAGIADSSTTVDVNQDMAVVRLLPDGTLDSTFGIGGRTTIVFDLEPNGQDIALATAQQSNGRLIVAGAAVAPSTGAIAATLVRLMPDGTPDATFGSVGKRTYDFGQSTPSGQLFNGIAFQDNQIVVVGSLNSGDTAHIDHFAARMTIDLIFANGFD